MRINGLSGVNAYSGIEPKKLNKEKSVNKEDKYQISELGNEYQFAIKKAREVEINRKEKVDTIKKAIENRTYNISAGEVAGKMLSDLKIQFSL